MIKDTKYGWVWVDGNKRPFQTYCRIKKGRNKGKIEIVLPEGKIRVSEKPIEQYPEEKD